MNSLQSNSVSPHSKVTVLFTSAGRRVALVRSFFRAINELQVEGRIVCVDASDLSAASQVADSHYIVPRCDDPNYIDVLLDICRRERVSLLFPLIDTELLILAQNSHRFRSIGCTPVVSELETISIARDKRSTAHFLQSIETATPAILNIDEVRSKPGIFPVFMKPIDGSASIGSRIIKTIDDLNYWFSRTPGALLLQYVSGREFTVDVYAGLDGVPRCAVPRLRLETRSGEVSKGMTAAELRIMEEAMRIVRCLPGPRGVLTLQCILPDSGIPQFFEINARFGGGVPLSIEAGANFPLWLLSEYLGKTPDVGCPGFRPQVLMLRYDDAIFIHKN
jgi:carbamoyl-phosphate synthase large subunit